MRYQEHREVEELSDDLRRRLVSAPLVVVPGFADKDVELPTTGEDVYPSGTGDFMKLARERGADIDYVRPDAPRVTMALYAAEYFIPILLAVREVLVSVEGDLLKEVILEWVKGGRPKQPDGDEELEAAEPRDSILHVKVGAVDLDAGKIEWFEASGSRDDVLEGIRQFRGR